MKKRLITTVALTAVSLLLTGCMYYSVTVDVKQDGTKPLDKARVCNPISEESPVVAQDIAGGQASNVNIVNSGNEKPIKVETAREASATIPLK